MRKGRTFQQCNASNLQIDTETITYTLPGKPAFTRVIDRTQDTLGRASGYSLGSTPASGVGGGTSPPPEQETSYAYSPTTGRLSEISNPQISNPFTYTYLPNSNLIASVTGPAHTVTNSWESTRNVLSSKENKVGTTNISTYLYGVNSIGQRTNVAKTGTAFAGVLDITWGYNSNVWGQCLGSGASSQQNPKNVAMKHLTPKERPLKRLTPKEIPLKTVE